MNFPLRRWIHEKVRCNHAILLRLALGLIALAWFISFTGFAAEKEMKKTTAKTAESDKDKMVAVEPMTVEEMKEAIRTHLFKKTQKAASGISKPDKTPWVWCSEQYDDHEKDHKALYGLIDEHLVIAESKFSKDKDLKIRRDGLGMAHESCRCALDPLKDVRLAIMICEAYLRPNLDAADERHWKYLGKQNILETMGDVYAAARDAKKFIEILRLLIENAHNRNTADGARLRLAQMLDRQGEYAEAIRCLKEIDEKEGMGGARRLIPDFEKKLKAQQPKGKQP